MRFLTIALVVLACGCSSDEQPELLEENILCHEIISGMFNSITIEIKSGNDGAVDVFDRIKREVKLKEYENLRDKHG